MSRVWKPPPALISRACRAFAAVASLQSSVTATFVPPHVKPAMKRKLATWQVALGDGSSFAACSQSWSTIARSRPATEHIACGSISVAICIASARIFTSLRPSSKSNTPAATMAVYSPRDSPATACGRATTSGLVSRSRSMAARPAMNISGWQYLVSASFSSGPSKATANGSQPRMLLAFSSMTLTAGLSATLFSMPTYWEPCPGNMRQALTGCTADSGAHTLDAGRLRGLGSAPSAASGRG
mmetsp:Transcript_6897/g.18547  ORF Transcript_6897/g.18547 Transcript_6897/m.18547 type:complete len:242 (-) Transcript_6897:670-1395(-)